MSFLRNLCKSKKVDEEERIEKEQRLNKIARAERDIIIERLLKKEQYDKQFDQLNPIFNQLVQLHPDYKHYDPQIHKFLIQNNVDILIDSNCEIKDKVADDIRQYLKNLINK